VLRLPAAVFAGVFAVVLVLDQLTKALVRTFMDPPGTTVNVVGRLLMFVHVRNAGASFGMLPGYAPVFMGVTTLVLAGVAVYWFRVRPRRALLVVALAVVTAGAVGNLIDRATAGLVTDFIQLPFDFPVFNVADIAIVTGVGMLVWWVLFGPAEHSAAVGDTTGPGTSPPAVGVDVSSQPTECDPASPETTDGG
jgi:signal peptidase II